MEVQKDLWEPLSRYGLLNHIALSFVYPLLMCPNVFSSGEYNYREYILAQPKTANSSYGCLKNK